VTPIKARPDLPVLLVYDQDPTYTASDAKEAENLLAQLVSALGDVGHAVASLPVCGLSWTKSLAGLDSRDWVVLNWCDGVPGVAYSEADIARELSAAGFTYTGSHDSVLSMSWDKPYVKRLLQRNGLPTPRWRLYDRSFTDGWEYFPAIVKPSHEHSSLGVTSDAVVLTPEDLREQVVYVLDTFHQPALVEDFVDGREFHVSVWGNHTLSVLPPAEMDFQAFGDVRDRLCTFDAKFTPGSRSYEGIGVLLPAPLDESQRAALDLVAVASYQALGCRDYGRLDIRLRDGIFYILDVNPNCDISPDASMALAAATDGYSYGAMLSRIVNLAAMRHPVFGPHCYSGPGSPNGAPRSSLGWF
jgi:D-alanine-D-alanine ligase